MKLLLCTLALFLPACSVPLFAQSAPTAGAPIVSQAQQDVAYRSCLKASGLHAAHYYCKQISYYLAPTTASQSDAGRTALLRPSSNPAPLASAIALKSIEAQVASSVLFEAERLDKQIGSPASSAASTNLVSKPGATQLLSLAVESGALTQTQSGNTITLQGNLDQVARFVIGDQQTLEYTTKGTPVLQNITVSSTLTTSAPSVSSIPISGIATASSVPVSSANVPTTATKLSSIGGRYQFQNKYDPKSAQFRDAYITALQSNGLLPVAAAGGALAKFFNAVDSCPDIAGPTSTLEAVIKSVDACIHTSVSSAEQGNKPEDLAAAAATLTKIIATNIEIYRQAVATAAGVPFTFEYTYNRPANQPDTHDFRGVATFGVGSGILNANVAASIYGSSRPATATYGRFHDFQFAGEFNRSLSAASPHAPAVSIAGYAQWQPAASVLTLTSTIVPAGVTLPADGQLFIMGTQGWLAVVQGKVTFKIGGAQIPLAAKWSNKTELLNKSSFGGQFGINYDISQIKQLIGLGGS